MNQGADYRSKKQRRAFVSPVPTKWDRLKWFGPGFVWMVSSVGSGSILFTPRVGSRYGYDLLWAALIVTFLTWVIIREIGRYTVISGRTILEGYNSIKGPKGWAVWLIFVPGIVSGIVVVAGIAALVGSALVIVLPLNQAVTSVGIILISAVLVISGHYKKLELVTTIMAVVMIVSVFLTAIAVFPGWGAYGRGLVPTMVPDFDLYFILPWFGFLLAGAAGMIWFSYWVAARGYGGEVIEGEATLPLKRRSNAMMRTHGCAVGWSSCRPRRPSVCLAPPLLIFLSSPWARSCFGHGESFQKASGWLRIWPGCWARSGADRVNICSWPAFSWLCGGLSSPIKTAGAGCTRMRH
jgi:hypothetical protein